MNTRWIVLILILCAVLLSACNLSRVTPTPTLAPPTDLPPLPNVTPSDANTIVIEGANGELCIIPADWVEYTVEQSDTLSLLALQTGSTQEELARVNCLTDPNNLIEGDVMYLPTIPVVGS